MARKLIPETMIVAAESFGDGLTAERVVGALARGLAAGGRTQVERLEQGAGLDPLALTALLRAARAVVIAAARLDERTLAGSAAFELATRARQLGVPAYAVTAHDRLSAFDARMLDLQLVLRARDARSLAAAGRRIAQVA